MGWIIALTIFYVVPVIGAYISTRKYYKLDDFENPEVIDIVFVFMPLFNIIAFIWNVNQNRKTQDKRTLTQIFFRL